MAELNPRDRLQPFLFDRLIDDQPGNQKESRDKNMLSPTQLRASIMRDVAWLFNTPGPVDRDGIAEFPEAAASVINFGVPDLTGTTGSSVRAGELERGFLRALTLFEPRLSKRGFRVSWRATDSSSTPLEAQVDVSTNDGRTWNNVAQDLIGSSYTVPASALPQSSRGRVRVRVGDGFNQTSAVSGRLRFTGTPPIVTITDVSPGSLIRSDGGVTLTAQALDETGRILSGRSLRWYDGRRFLGAGAEMSLTSLAPGRHRLSVRARGHFPNEQAALKCLYLTVRSLDPTGRGRKRWMNRWNAALNAFAVTF